MTVARVWLLMATSLIVACGPEGAGRDPSSLLVAGRSNLSVVIPSEAPPYLEMAAEDLLEVAARRVGAAHPSEVMRHDGAPDPSRAPTGIVVLAGVDLLDSQAPKSFSRPLEDTREGQGFSLLKEKRDGRTVVTVSGATPLAVAYGLYELAALMGARYYHPRESFVPVDPGAELPAGLEEGLTRSPHARLRGFHQHTQHPIVWSDYLLQPDPANRAPITEYLRYLLRNRQNVFEWHMLGTVNRAEWDDHARFIVAEAHRHGVKAAMVVGFADMQQNAYRLVTDLGEGRPREERIALQRAQVREGLDDLLPLGLDILVFQFGTTEMTNLSDEETLGWFEELSEWQSEWAPSMEVYAWIHTPADLLADDGETPFFHLPLQSPPDIGLYVHTTMFYDLENPAPVYNNQDFIHQQRCFEEGAGVRSLVYYPETAWWLGFDNNLPLFLPITLYSRAHDVQEVIPPLIDPYPLDGHITFTTGIEWGYWMFDDFVSRLTWQPDLGWRDYVVEISEIYGPAASEVADVLIGLTERQIADFYDTNPLIFFYLAGESRHDEIGAVAGLTGRPVKPSFLDIYNLGSEAFQDWLGGDYAQLIEIRDAYLGLVAELDHLSELEDPSDPGLADRFFELKSALEVTAWRAEHTVALYGAVAAARGGDEAAAEAGLQAARDITEAVRARVAEVEERVYRYPLELQSEEKPSSLTAYPFGAYHETRTAYFWARRDEQLAGMLDVVFGRLEEEWSEPEIDHLRASIREETVAVEPEIDQGTRALIAGYIPTLLLALGPEEDGVRRVLMAVDQNGNGLPDVGTEVDGTWETSSPEFEVVFETLPIPIGATGASAGNLIVRGGSFEVTATGGLEAEEWPAALQGAVNFSDIKDVLVETGMFDYDTAWQLLAGLFGVDPAAEPRPETFPLRVETVFIGFSAGLP